MSLSRRTFLARTASAAAALVAACALPLTACAASKPQPGGPIPRPRLGKPRWYARACEGRVYCINENGREAMQSDFAASQEWAGAIADAITDGLDPHLLNMVPWVPTRDDQAALV